MKKILTKFTLFITFFIILGLSYIIKLIGIASQGTTFIYSVGVLIFLMSLKIFLGVLINDYRTYKLLIILFMISMYGITLFVSWLAIKMLNVDFEAAFQLITFGIVLESIGKGKNNHLTEQECD